MLVDQNLNRVSSILIDYYIKDSYIIWVGNVYNTTSTDFVDCKITTTPTFEGVFFISGGGVTGYVPITSDLDTTCSLGTIVSGGIEPILLQIHISGGSSLAGLQVAPLYITK